MTTAKKRGRPPKQKAPIKATKKEYILPIIATEVATLDLRPLAINVKVDGKVPPGNKTMILYNNEKCILQSLIRVETKPIAMADLQKQLTVTAINISPMLDKFIVEEGLHIANLYIKVES